MVFMEGTCTPFVEETRHEHEPKDDLRCFVRKVMEYLIEDLNWKELRSVILLC